MSRRSGAIHSVLISGGDNMDWGRLFGPHEMSIPAVLASACASMMFDPVELDRSFYWDGSYAAN